MATWGVYGSRRVSGSGSPIAKLNNLPLFRFDVEIPVHFVIVERTNACRSKSKCFRPQLKPVAKRSCSEMNVAVTLVAIRLAHALHIPDRIRFTLWVARHPSRFGSQHRAPSENVSASLKAVLRDHPRFCNDSARSRITSLIGAPLIGYSAWSFRKRQYATGGAESMRDDRRAP